ncbi:MAG: formylmethanofuran dehydrogenase subunit B [Nitrosomonadales bacterium]|nr:formylmethanofuran dehydrogenase subunit B [Nitrosomonadales bacterium]
MQSSGKSQTDLTSMSSDGNVREHVACPACGLLCDDLTIAQINTDAIKVTKNGCTKGIRFFEQVPIETKPRIAGKPATLESAIAKAAEILTNSNLPLFAGLSTEVQGMRAVMQLADSVGATLDHMNSHSSLRNTLVVQNAGWMVTTLTEVRNRVDLLLIIGTDIVSYNSRFFERQIWNTETMFGQDTSGREVVYLGGRDLNTSHGISPNSTKPTVLECDIEKLPEVTAALHALVAGKKLFAESVAGIPTDELAKLAARLHEAKYSVVTWISSALDFSHAELTVQNITETVIKLNEKTRSSGLPLGGSEGDYSASQTSTWISGYPVRNSYKQGYPEYDPYHFSTARLLETGEADSLLWINSFSAEKTPPATKIPAIVLGHAGTKFTQEPDVFIPVGIPGIDHAGTMFRIDSSVTLPLGKLRTSNVPALAVVITAIEQAMKLDASHAD